MLKQNCEILSRDLLEGREGKLWARSVDEETPLTIGDPPPPHTHTISMSYIHHFPAPSPYRYVVYALSSYDCFHCGSFKQSQTSGWVNVAQPNADFNIGFHPFLIL
jgi:hypothetical protein